jgi:hypothetical protein
VLREKIKTGREIFTADARGRVRLKQEGSKLKAKNSPRRSLRALRKTKYKTLCVLSVLSGENLNSGCEK